MIKNVYKVNSSTMIDKSIFFISVQIWSKLSRKLFIWIYNLIFRKKKIIIIKDNCCLMVYERFSCTKDVQINMNDNKKKYIS